MVVWRDEKTEKENLSFDFDFAIEKYGSLIDLIISLRNQC